MTTSVHTPWARAIFAEQRLWLACSCGWNAMGDAGGTWNDHAALADQEAPDDEPWDPHAVDMDHPCIVCGSSLSHDHPSAVFDAALAAQLLERPTE